MRKELMPILQINLIFVLEKNFIGNYVLLEIFRKCLLNPLALLYVLVEVILLSMTAARAELNKLFKYIRFLLSFQVFSQSINIGLKVICKM